MSRSLEKPVRRPFKRAETLGWSMPMSFAAATVFGIGVAYYWPTMLGLTAERFPKGGAFLLGIIGAAGGLFLSYVSVPGMGKVHDHYTLNALPAEVLARTTSG